MSLSFTWESSFQTGDLFCKTVTLSLNFESYLAVSVSFSVKNAIWFSTNVNSDIPFVGWHSSRSQSKSMPGITTVILRGPKFVYYLWLFLLVFLNIKISRRHFNDFSEGKNAFVRRSITYFVRKNWFHQRENLLLSGTLPCFQNEDSCSICFMWNDFRLLFNKDFWLPLKPRTFVS